MTTPTLDELVTPATTEEATATFYTSLSTRGVSHTTWKAGDPVRTLIAALAIMLSAFSTLQSLIAKSGFLALSTKSWLTLVAKYVYGVDRDLGSFASGSIAFTNTAGGVFSFGVGEVVASNGTKTYRNTAAVTLASLGTATVAFLADEIGSASSTGGATITTLVTPMTGVTITNAAAFVGNDEETDPALRLRCTEKLGVLGVNGPADGYAFVSRSAKRANGSSIGVTRVKTVPDGIGGIDLYVATGSGGVTGTVGDLATDLGLVDDGVQRQSVPRGITCRTHTATALTVPCTYELWIPDTNTQTDPEVEADVDAALLAFLSSRPIGGDVISPAAGFVYKTALEDVIGNAIPGTIKRAVTVPVGDVAVSATEAPVEASNTVTAIHRVPRATL